MTVTVSVNATWRMSRVEFTLLYGYPQTVNGQGEVVLQETIPPSAEAEILRRRVRPGGQADPTTYGTLPGDMVSRVIDAALLAETVEVNGTTLSLETVMLATQAFLVRWREEDIANPPEPQPPATTTS